MTHQQSVPSKCFPGEQHLQDYRKKTNLAIPAARGRNPNKVYSTVMSHPTYCTHPLQDMPRTLGNIRSQA